MKNQKIAMITGASSGIGYALALELASRGISVVAIARNEEALIRLQAQDQEMIRIIPADITTQSGRKKIIDDIQNLEINYLIHAAGIISPLGPLHHLSENEIRNILETNLLAPVFLTLKLIPFFDHSQEGRILNISSVSGMYPTTGLGAYCISKAGLDMWTRSLQLELEPQGIIAAKVIPGEIETGMQEALRDAPLDQFPLALEFKKAYEQATLILPEICGDFLADLLLETTKADYVGKEWNIYNDYHKKPLPLPLNKKKLNKKT